MTKKVVAGYVWRQELNRAMNANRRARMAMMRIVDDDLSRNVVLVLASRVMCALADGQDALVELERIVNGKDKNN